MSQCAEQHSAGSTRVSTMISVILCVWCVAILRWICEQNSVCIKFCANLRKSAMQWFSKCLGDKAWAIHVCFSGKTGEEQSEEHDIVFFDTKEIVQKIFVLSKQLIPRTTVKFCDGSVKMCSSDCPNFGIKGTGCCIMTTCSVTSPLSPGPFCQNTIWLYPTHHTCQIWHLAT